MSNRRLNVRFNLDNPDEKKANDYLIILQPAGKNLCYRIVLKSNINCLRKERYILFRGSF